MAIELASLEIPIRVTGDTTAAGALRRVEVAGVTAANRITAATTGATTSLTRMTGAATAATPAMAGLAATATRLAGAFGAVLGVQAIAGLLRDSVKEAQEAEKVWARLESAVTASGVAYAAVAPRIEAATKRIQASTRFDDESAARGLATLISITGDYEKALAALPVAADLAVRAQTDLDTASKLLGRAIIGQTETLARYGIVIDKSRDALEQIREQSAGYAERDARTLTGQLALQANQWQDLKEAIGRGVLPALVALRGAALDVARVLSQNGPLVAGVLAAATAVGTLTLAVKALGAAAAFVAAGGLARLGAALIALAANPVVLAIVALAGTVGFLTTKLIEGKRAADQHAQALRDLAAAGKHADPILARLMAYGRHDPPKPAPTPEELEKQRKAFDALTASLVALESGGNATADVVARMERQLAAVTATLNAGNVSLERRVELLAQQRALEEGIARQRTTTPFTPEAPPIPLPGRVLNPNPNRQLVTPTSDMIASIEDGYRQVTDAMQAANDRAATLAADLNATIIGGIVGLASGLGAALAGDGNFGDVLLGGLGQAFQQFGAAIIAGSVIIQKALAALASLNPVAAIALGGALIAVGAMLSAKARQSFGTGSGVARGGGTAPADVTRSITVGPTGHTATQTTATASRLTPVQPMQIGTLVALRPDAPEWTKFFSDSSVIVARRGLAFGHG